VYVPLDALAAVGTDVSALAAERASPALKSVISGLAARTGDLLTRSRSLAPAVTDLRIGLEVGVIQAIAEDLTRRLMRRDPLSERVHLTPIEALGASLRGVSLALGSRVAGRQSRLAPA
jgi:phytoene/squalene synthetase